MYHVPAAPQSHMALCSKLKPSAITNHVAILLADVFTWHSFYILPFLSLQSRLCESIRANRQNLAYQSATLIHPTHRNAAQNKTALHPCNCSMPAHQICNHHASVHQENTLYLQF